MDVTADHFLQIHFAARRPRTRRAVGRQISWKIRIRVHNIT